MFRLAVFILMWACTNSFAKEVKLLAHDGFELSAEFRGPLTVSSRYDSGSKSILDNDEKKPKGVLMLHQCNASKEMYRSLADELSTKGISSLALDFRGFGKSTTFEISKDQVRKAAKNRKDFLKKLRNIQQHWVQDVEVAFLYLANQVGADNIAFIGASCGGGQAIELAQTHKPNSIIIISSGLDKNHRSIFGNVLDIPMLIVAAQGDENTYEISHRMFLKTENRHSRFISYKGKEHGRTLFKLDPDLQSTMVNWLERH